MGEILAEMARAQAALGRPTLRLLDGKWAAMRVAVFRCAFSRDRRSVQADRLHAQVEAYLGDLQREGVDVPGSTGRELCRQWVADQWLFRDKDEEDNLVYSLTSSALEALDLVAGLARDRVLVSESRLSMILETVRSWALEASPDAAARMERLDAQIREMTLERDRLADGGQVAPFSDDRMLDGYANLISLIGQLPSDFKRVEESVLDMHRSILRDLRDDDRRVVDVLDEYLERHDRLVNSTPEGRAFDSAIVLLRDNALLDELQVNIGSLLEHPAAVALDARDLAEIRGAVTAIRRGTHDVLEQRRRVTSTLKQHIVHRDALEERELDRVLREIERGLAVWMETAGPRATVPIDLLPPTLRLGHLRERTWDPNSAAAPPPLEQPDDDVPLPPSIEELRMRGGPSLDALRAALIAGIAGGAETLGTVFNGLPSELRRPVEILGLLHLCAVLDAPDQDAAVEPYESIRPGGAARAFTVPVTRLAREYASVLEAMYPEGGDHDG